MATTIVQTWATDISQLGPVYPFVGSEFILWIIGLAFWISFHIMQIRIEDRELASEAEAAKRPETVNRVLDDEKEVH